MGSELGETVAARTSISRLVRVGVASSSTVTVTVLCARLDLGPLSKCSSSARKTYTASGVTVVKRKLLQSAERALAAVRPSRVPVMARLQLLPAQARFSTATLARATDTNDRTAANFMLTDWSMD